MAVNAEGMEAAQQRVFLASQGCPEGQGTLSSAPMPAAEFVAHWLEVKDWHRSAEMTGVMV